VQNGLNRKAEVASEKCFGDEIPEGSAVIEVRLTELSQLFNSIDPSPFYEKDLDRDAEEFIVATARELPSDRPLALLVHLDRPAVTPEAADALRTAIRTFFRNEVDQSRRRVRQLFRVGRMSLLIGLLFLALCFLISEEILRALPETALARLLRESVIIGGWVAMWRPLEIFLYDWWPIRAEGRLHERLSRMTVRIACSGREAPAREPAPF
jgi:hypothetical protein